MAQSSQQDEKIYKLKEKIQQHISMRKRVRLEYEKKDRQYKKRIKAKDVCKPNTGSIDFQKFLVCLFPNLTMENMDQVNVWLPNRSNTSSNFSQDNKKKKMKRAIPKDSIDKLAQLFERYDTNRNGCKTFSLTR
jgi:hypothetical protein